MIYCLENNDIDDKKGDLNYIISNFSNKIIINKESEIKDEFCEIYLNKKKIKFERFSIINRNSFILYFLKYIF